MIPPPLYFRSPGWIGIRVGRFYLKIRDVRRHPLRFSERNRHDYKPILVVGENWHVGISGPPLRGWRLVERWDDIVADIGRMWPT